MDDDILYMLDIASVRRKMQANIRPALLQMRRERGYTQQIIRGSYP